MQLTNVVPALTVTQLVIPCVQRVWRVHMYVFHGFTNAQGSSAVAMLSFLSEASEDPHLLFAGFASLFLK